MKSRPSAKPRARTTTRTRAGRPSGVRAVSPSGAMATYTRAMLEVDAAIAEAITREVERAGLAPTRTNAAADGAPGPVDPEVLRALLRRLRSILGGLSLLLRPALRVLDLVAGRVIDHSGREWARQLRALGVNINDVKAPDVRQLRALWQRRNLDLIKTLGAEKLERVERAIREHKGARVETLARRIAEATGTGDGHARLLARDQTLKLMGQVQQARHQAAGITEYVWRSSRDERVRKRHKELDGTRQKYSEPPVVDLRTGRRAHPGDDYQCRCTADPVLPGIDDVS